MLWASLLLPSLPLDVFARAQEADTPFVVTTGGHHPRIVAASDAARIAGIRREQPIATALALAPDIIIRERDTAAEEAALADVATMLLAFTPRASLAPPNAVVAEIAGSLRLFGGLAQLDEALSRAASARGYDATLAVAPTPTAALLLARGGCTTPVLAVDALPAALAALPLALLDIDADTLATLEAAGVTTFAAAQALPRAGLARRFGAHLVDLLDRALGRASDPRVPFVSPPHFERSLPLPAPVESVEALQFAVNRLVGDFADWLTARGLGALRMSLTLVHERYVRDRGTPPTVATFALGEPARMPAHLATVLRERLARVALPAAVEAIMLASDETAPLASRNLGLLPDDGVDAVVVPLVDRLRSRLGERVVTTLALADEHRPEQAAREIPALASKAASRTATKRASAASRRAKAKTTRVPTGAQAPRPLWLLDCPRPLGGVLEAAPWVLRDGPERIESGWWDGRDCRRDYFVAATPDGEIAWIYRDHRYATDDGEWFMHGLFA